jgi:hypothetical protein
LVARREDIGRRKREEEDKRRERDRARVHRSR